MNKKRPKSNSSLERKKKMKLIKVTTYKAGKAMKDIGSTSALLSVPVYEFLYW